MLVVILFVAFKRCGKPSVRENLFRPSWLKLLAVAVAIGAGILEEVIFRRWTMNWLMSSRLRCRPASFRFRSALWCGSCHLGLDGKERACRYGCDAGDQFARSHAGHRFPAFRPQLGTLHRRAFPNQFADRTGARPCRHTRRNGSKLKIQIRTSSIGLSKRGLSVSCFDAAASPSSRRPWLPPSSWAISTRVLKSPRPPGSFSMRCLHKSARKPTQSALANYRPMSVRRTRPISSPFSATPANFLENGDEASFTQQIRQLEYSAATEPLRDACETVITRLRKERADKEAAAAAEVVVVLQKAGEVVRTAKTPAGS